MVDFLSPAVIATDSLTLLKFWHVVDGVFIWEFFTTLDFEWSVIRGRRPYRPTIWIYSLTRAAALAAVIDNLIILNITTRIHCRSMVVLEMVPAYLALAAASLLLLFRIVAIWDKNTPVIVIAACVWGTNSAFLIQGISRLRYRREMLGGPCVALNIQTTKVTMIVAFVTDILLLAIMLVGLLRLRCHQRGTLATGRFLWNQGVIWLLLATVAGVLPTVFVSLNLNEPLSVMFQVPWLLTMSIAATRMYRTLQTFLSSDLHGDSHEIPNTGTISISPNWNTASVAIPLSGIEVGMGTADEQRRTSQTSHHGLDRNADGLVHDKPHGLV